MGEEGQGRGEVVIYETFNNLKSGFLKRRKTADVRENAAILSGRLETETVPQKIGIMNTQLRELKKELERRARADFLRRESKRIKFHTTWET